MARGRASKRASLAQALIASLDEDAEIEEAWITEALEIAALF